ncbi:transposase [Streptomyces sp. ME01-18a]|uniref:transposase n=1 Tax=Streptomyces sp. ME01-18a TaxID=3028669 RepID=UPI0029AEF615|nr:transposase [Streptomyces sp. ME01-18a]MDX3433937.1 transposase [Streptomyces sp. ME01-18a]
MSTSLTPTSAASSTTDAIFTRNGTRASIEGTIHQAVAVAGMGRARYLGFQKTHLEHAFSAAAHNHIRLEARWNGHPLDRTRVSHLARLNLSLAA